MDNLVNYRHLIKKILTEYDEMANRSLKKKYETCLIFDETHDHYLWMSVDWFNQKRINNIHVHIRIKIDFAAVVREEGRVGCGKSVRN